MKILHSVMVIGVAMISTSALAMEFASMSDNVIDTEVASLSSRASTHAAPAPTKPGDQAEAWLNVQASGALASSNPQAAKTIQRDKAAERLMKTYDFPIKESYYGDNFTPGQ